MCLSPGEMLVDFGHECTSIVPQSEDILVENCLHYLPTSPKRHYEYQYHTEVHYDTAWHGHASRVNHSGNTRHAINNKMHRGALQTHASIVTQLAKNQGTFVQVRLIEGAGSHAFRRNSYPKRHVVGKDTR